MITIDQLLESVDLDFEPRWVTKDKSGDITMFLHKPTPEDWCKEWRGRETKYSVFGGIKLAEFADKHWTECIYEVPRKTTGKIIKLGVSDVSDSDNGINQLIVNLITTKINELVDAVNEINENYACIAALTDIRKRLDTLENEGVKNE